MQDCKAPFAANQITNGTTIIEKPIKNQRTNWPNCFQSFSNIFRKKIAAQNTIQTAIMLGLNKHTAPIEIPDIAILYHEIRLFSR